MTVITTFCSSALWCHWSNALAGRARTRLFFVNAHSHVQAELALGDWAGQRLAAGTPPHFAALRNAHQALRGLLSGGQSEHPLRLALQKKFSGSWGLKTSEAWTKRQRERRRLCDPQRLTPLPCAAPRPIRLSLRLAGALLALTRIHVILPSEPPPTGSTAPMQHTSVCSSREQAGVPWWAQDGWLTRSPD